jgi:two-component system nitrate/nitrite response regulator NarL
MATTLVLAEEQPMNLFALKTILSSEADFTVVAQCSDGNEILQLLDQHSPDVLVLSRNLPVKDGIAIMRELYEAGSTTLVVLLMVGPDGDTLLDALRWGARGIVLVDSAIQLLVPCIRKVVAGGYWLELDSVRRALDKALQGKFRANTTLNNLSLREAKLVHLVSEGCSNKVIARQINSTEGAVKTYLHRLYHKLEVRGRLDLARLGIENDL